MDDTSVGARALTTNPNFYREMGGLGKYFGRRIEAYLSVWMDENYMFLVI